MRQDVMIFLVVALLGLISMVQGHCEFTDDAVQNETRLVAIRFANGELGIFQEDKVRVGTTLYFICSNDGDDIVRVTCRARNRFNKELPIRNCSNTPKAIVERIIDEDCNAETYRVGYKVGDAFLEVYRSCYNKSAMRVLFTWHDAFPYSLVTQRPESAFTGDGIVSIRDASSFQAKSIYNRFQNLFENQQDYVTSMTEILIDRGHLTPSADFLFPVNMRSTFKYINVIPQFSSINRGNWKMIEDWTRKHVDAYGSKRIFTGTFDVLSLPDQNNNSVPIYLQDGQRNPIPKWIFKFLLNVDNTVVFLTYNNIFNETPEPAVCKIVTCPIQLKASKESGFTYCCDPTDFLQNVWPLIRME